MRVYTYRSYEYERAPLFFLDLSDYGLSAEGKVDILSALDMLYGDTDQETTDWALEYELWCRMLLSQDALMVNPQYLGMECDGTCMPADLQNALEAHLPADAIARYQSALEAKDEIAAFAGEWTYFEIPRSGKTPQMEKAVFFPGVKARLDMEKLLAETEGEPLRAALQDILDRDGMGKVYTVAAYLPHSSTEGPIILDGLPHLGFSAESLIIVEE